MRNYAEKTCRFLCGFDYFGIIFRILGDIQYKIANMQKQNV